MNLGVIELLIWATAVTRFAPAITALSAVSPDLIGRMSLQSLLQNC